MVRHEKRRPQTRPPELQHGVSLEGDLGLHFDHSRGSISAQTGTINGCRLADGSEDLSELRVVDIRDREREIRMVE